MFVKESLCCSSVLYALWNWFDRRGCSADLKLEVERWSSNMINFFVFLHSFSYFIPAPLPPQYRSSLSCSTLTFIDFLCGVTANQKPGWAQGSALSSIFLHCPLFCVALHCPALFYIVLRFQALSCTVNHCLYFPAMFRIAPYCPAYSFVVSCTDFYCPAQFCTVLHSPALSCNCPALWIVIHCPALACIVLRCEALSCTFLRSPAGALYSIVKVLPPPTHCKKSWRKTSPAWPDDAVLKYQGDGTLSTCWTS